MSEIEFNQDDAVPVAPVEVSATPVPETPIEEPIVKEPEVPSPNAIQTESIDLTESKPTGYRFSMPSVNLMSFANQLKKLKLSNFDTTTETLKEWKQVNEEAVDYYTIGGMYQNRFTDSESRFKQGIESKDGVFLNGISNLKFKKTDGELKGEIALLKVSKFLGLGDVMNIPLPHSGIWVTIKPPTEKDLIDFYNTVFREKVIFGRATHGLTLTNFSTHINNRLFDFILRHVHSVNYSDITKEDLKNYILIHDYPILAWGFACTMYPNGFDYQRACVSNLSECSHIAKATINLTKLLWIDNPSLSESQKQILSENRPNRLSVESYRKFISEHSRVVSSEFETKNHIKFKLKVPTFNEYLTDGLEWVNKINSSIESVIIEDAENTDEAKAEILNQYVKASVLRQFNHFIDYIEVDENVITDRVTLNEVLEVFSSDDDLRQEITDNILKFKAKTTLALIGIPEYKCPNCHGEQNPNPVNDQFTSVIPLDVLNLFFTLITLRVSRILEREV